MLLYIVLAYLMLFAALTNAVCLNNASFFLFVIDLCKCYLFSCFVFVHFIFLICIMLLLLLSTPLHQRAASRVQHPKSCGSQQSLPPGGKERLHFVGIRPEVQARKGGW